MVIRPDSPFRHHVPELGSGIVTRVRLLGELRQRFDRRLVVVSASAGFGKTTLLAQCVLENELDPSGVDLWLQVTDRDREPDVLLAGLAEALAEAAPTRVDDASGVDELIESIWASAPLDISIIIDDAHLLDGSPSWKTLADLCAGMPTNGHLVIGSRTLPPLPIRSLQSRGDVIVVDEEQMAFDESEISNFAEMRGIARDVSAELPVWPALAALTSSAGPEASVGFVWESILDAIPGDRRQALALLVRFSRIDDDLVAAIVGERWTAARLVDGLPLIESIDNDRRFHDLWAEALADEADPADWRSALVHGARVLSERGEPMRAARCLFHAGAAEQLVESARAFAKASMSSGLSAADAVWFSQALPQSVRNGPLGRYLRLVHSSSYGNEASTEEMQDIALVAFDSGDDELAALAMWRLVQMYGDSSLQNMRVSETMQAILDLDEPYAEASSGLIRSHFAEIRHDVQTALDAASMFDRLEPDARHASIASRYVALGHPELVPTSLLEVLDNGVSDPVDAQAIWLRGEIDAEAAWSVASDLPARYGRRRLANVQVPLMSIVSSVALAAGEVEAGRELAGLALVAAEGSQPKLFLFAGVADALATLASDGHEAAVKAFTDLNERVPVAPWPAWAYVSVMAPVRALVPGTEWLDDLDFGPVVSMAVKAGRLLAELYDGGTGAEAIDLPWNMPNTMRAHIPVAMLCELACAAGLDDPQVAACFAGLPNGIGILRTLLDHPSPVVVAVVATRLSDEPERPTYNLAVSTLGELSVHRSDGVAVSERVRGGRVQELLSHLLVETAPRRNDIARAIWPDLTDKKAAGNLRITLASLLDLIEPDRVSGTSWFIRSHDGRIELSSDGVSTDIGTMERDLDVAREAERNGLPTIALEHFRLALEAYDGDFLPATDIEKVIHDRLRYQSLAYNAGCRVSELLLAKGEPEAAMPFAARATQIDPIAERAHRLEIRCHLALGSRSAARQIGKRLTAMLDREGLAPDYETTQLLATL